MIKVLRPSKRANDEIRQVSVETNIINHAAGSCLIKYGNTHVLCTASVDEKIPPFLKGQNQGWLTAEYGMLPASTHSRIRREAKSGKQEGRTTEIQRLIGRSLRAAIDMRKLGERQIIIDCDVIQADGGTRTASITGGFVALNLAINKLLDENILKTNPIIHKIAAISCGIYAGEIVTDLDYAEDSVAHTDMNFVMTDKGKIIEVQGTAESEPFSFSQLSKMYELAEKSINEIFGIINV